MAEDLSEYLDPAWEAEETDHEAPDGSAVWKDRNGDFFYLRRKDEGGATVGREAWTHAAPAVLKTGGKHHAPKGG